MCIIINWKFLCWKIAFMIKFVFKSHVNLKTKCWIENVILFIYCNCKANELNERFVLVYKLVSSWNMIVLSLNHRLLKLKEEYLHFCILYLCLFDSYKLQAPKMHFFSNKSEKKYWMLALIHARLINKRYWGI